ncbi:ATP-binding protein [Streptomyces sp. MB09-01]|uniref:ATP-binding protein n=1 Tax=Streptomyces sp. MB09-01 TaxID=3028666 RepID=UPI0029A15870|nr:ATP-binding protein [Streptomyces sp. MB09-01]MDX3533764.1 ATP-binding protein [Streptomyces sp. MB09-01]
MELPSAVPHDTRHAEVGIHFGGAPGCIAEAREAAVAFLRHHSRPARRTFHDDVLLVVSELVSNAVRHAPGPFVLELGLVPGGIEVTVRDTSSRPPHSRPPDRTGGRGWSIVQSLARRVRVVPCHNGKTVHAELLW